MSTPGPVDTADVEAQLQALHGSAALLDDTDRAILRVRGDQAREHFGGLVTNHVEALAPDRAVYAFMLTARGRPVAEMRVLARPPDEEGREVLWADLPGVCLEPTLEHLERYLPPRLASYEATGDVGRLAVVGPAAADALGRTGAQRLPETPLEARELEPGVLGGAVVVRREEVEGPGYDLYLPTDALPGARDALARAVEEAGGRPAGPEAREIWRVERGVPAYGAEIDTDVLPQETGQADRAVDHEKGCYTGQEVVARIHHRGQVNRHLRGLRFDPSVEAPPEPGTELYAGGRSRAVVTTAVRSPDRGVIALGYVWRELEPGAALALEEEGDPVCRVEALPFA